MTTHTGYRRESPWDLAVGPGPEHWDDWVEYDPKQWPTRVERHYAIVPTICFNCESACGLLAFVDKQDGAIAKFEGNPVHPGSRGRTCAKGPATLNQVQDPDRILEPMKRVGPRGSGKFEPVSWDDALADIGARIAKALDENRRDEIMYHVGRPGEDHFVLRMLQAWGVDGHNSHTNVCSSSARFGYTLWMGADRPSPDYAGAEFLLLISAHLETGHYFNPHAQRVVEAKERGARLAVIDTRLSNTASRADLWVSTWPGSEPALLLAVARELLRRGAIDREFVRRWTNWQQALQHLAPAAVTGNLDADFDAFLAALAKHYDAYTPELAAQECRMPVETVAKLADEIQRAGTRFTSHVWRSAASGNLGGWQVARCLMLLHVLTGSVGREGGVNPNTWDKFAPKPSQNPPAQSHWSEVLFPREWPLSHYEMSFLLPHLLREQKKRLEVYFTRVYNPIWTNPDGCSWIEMFEEENRVGCHVALTPTWSETAQWADYVLPMGHGPERHDLMSQETHAGTWIGFRQPVRREYERRAGREHELTLGANPGQVWEEAEFWIALTWHVDPDGTRGIRRWYESKLQAGQPVSMDEYFGDIFEHSVPGLPAAAAAEQKTPLEYMRRYGAFEVPYGGQQRYEAPVKEGGVVLEDGSRRAGFKTESGRLDLYSKTLAEWGHADVALPEYIRSHVHWRALDERAGEMVLLPTFRLPTLIHTRSANSKWLQEISHTNPLWVHPEDAERLGLATGDLARVATRIGWFVPRVWVTEGIHPGIVACSHHVGRWRLQDRNGVSRGSSSLVEIQRQQSAFLIRHKQEATAHASSDPDTERIWWTECGVNQNLTFPVQPDPASGMHCWHQVVRVERARDEDRYGDVYVDTQRSREVYREWLARAKPAPGPGGLRRPLWMNRPLRPRDECFKLPTS
ncbi:MAG: formate dehydrogenase [Planctomycetota bacterium]|nr:MAG: formate dehydrogenase [Planctomycetota bacterium]